MIKKEKKLSNPLIEYSIENNKYLKYKREFYMELEGQSDRGIVLISLSILDEMLADLIKGRLVDTNKNIIKEMFSTKGTFGQLDDKIKGAFVLGLISETDYNLLIILQKVRNKFAHQVLNINFEHDSVKGLCNNIVLPPNSYIPEEIPNVKKGDPLPKVDLNPIKKDTTARNRFIYTYKYLFQQLGYRIFQGENQRLQKPKKEFLDSLSGVEDFQKGKIEIEKFIEDNKEVLLENELLEEYEDALKGYNKLADVYELIHEIIEGSKI